MSLSKTLVLLLSMLLLPPGALLLPPGLAAADDSQADLSADEIAALVKQLDADAYAGREAATKRLTEAGLPAVEALAKAAAGESLEAANRAKRILADLAKSSDEPTREAAEKALEKIRKENPDATLPPPAQIQAGNAQIPLLQGNGVINATAKSISISNNNGVKTIEAQEDGRKVRIVSDPNKGITVEITEPKDGKDVTRKIEAKDVEELKKKDKKAYEIFKEYDQNGGGLGGAIQVQIQAGGIGGPIQIQPALPPNIRQKIFRIQAGADDPVKRVEQATEQLRKLGSQLDELRKQAESSEDLQKALDELQKEMKKQLEAIETKPDEQ